MPGSPASCLGRRPASCGQIVKFFILVCYVAMHAPAFDLLFSGVSEFHLYMAVQGTLHGICFDSQLKMYQKFSQALLKWPNFDPCMASLRDKFYVCPVYFYFFSLLPRLLRYKKKK